MLKTLLWFLRKTYVIWIILFSVGLFFFGYNTYLVDHSLSNLKLVLSKIDDVKTAADARKLAALLDFSLITEAGASTVDPATIAKIELAKSILSDFQDLSQMEDVKFLLGEVTQKKEKGRAGAMVMLDTLTGVFRPAEEISRPGLEKQAAGLKLKIKGLQDRADLQRTYLELATIYTKLADHANAKVYYELAIESATDTLLARRARLAIAWNEKYQGNLDEAFRQFEALSVSSKDRDTMLFALYQMADILVQKGEGDKACELFMRIGREFPDENIGQLSGFRNCYTRVYQMQGEARETAIEECEKEKDILNNVAIISHISNTTMPTIAALHIQRGFVLLREGRSSKLADRYREAIVYFDKTLKAVPDDKLAYIGKALAYLWLNDNANALVFGEKAWENLHGKDVVEIRRIRVLGEGIVLVNLGYIYLELNFTAKALDIFKEAIKVNSKDSIAYYNLGYAYLKDGKTHEATTAFLLVTKLNPDFAFAFNNLGWCYWQLKEYSKSVNAFKRAVAINPKLSSAIINLAKVYIASGNEGEARDLLGSISDTDPEFSSAFEELEKIKKAAINKGSPKGLVQ